MKKDKLSIVVPCFCEQDTLDPFYMELTKSIDKIKNLSFEVIFVDDGSTDQTRTKILELSNQNKNVKYIFLSRNFGKESAMLAGLEKASGDYVAIMDADLQDPPSLLPEMFSYLKSNEYDSVATRRVSRDGEPVIRSFFARLFYKLINKMTNIDIVDGARDFRLMNRKYLNALLSLKEKSRFSKGLFAWVGFRTKWIEYKNIERVAGETSWSFWKLLKYSIEGFVSFSTMPLVIASIVGSIISFVALIAIVLICVRYFVFGDPVAGWTSLVCVILLLSGLQMFFIGIIGQYLAKMFTEVKARPTYLISETNIK